MNTSNIFELMGSGVTGITLTLPLEQLKEIVDYAVESAKEKLLPLMVDMAKENLLTKQEVMDKFQVCHTTLWNWEKKGHLIPVKIGRKINYRQADVEYLIQSRGK